MKLIKSTMATKKVDAEKSPDDAENALNGEDQAGDADNERVIIDTP